MVCAWWFGWLGAPPHKLSSQIKGPEKVAYASIAEQAKRLAPMRPPQPTPFAQAIEVRDAIRSGKFLKADDAIKSVLRKSRMGPWTFQPFTAFMSELAAPGDAKFASRLNAWVLAKPDSALAHLVRANYYLNLGWWIRGNGFAEDVRANNRQTFGFAINIAAHDAREALKINRRDPYAWSIYLEILKSAGAAATQKQVFDEAIHAFPEYYSLYRIRLSTLQPKWLGTVQDMYRFVTKYAGGTSIISPRRMLVVQLYAELLGASSDVCAAAHVSPLNRCVRTIMHRVITPGLKKAAYAALRRPKGVSALALSDELERILPGMIMTSGGGHAAAGFLQAAARTLGSDTQLVARDTTKNNFMIDRMAALVWYEHGQMANAETLDKRALSDLSNTRFPDRYSEDKARAAIYTDLASIYNRKHKFRRVVVYEKAAARLLGGEGARPGFDALECAALFRLKLYRHGLKTCKAIVAANGNLQTRFWLGRIEDVLGKSDAAVRDYGLVASSESGYRDYAGIAVAVIYDREGKWQASLNALNQYSYLFKKAYDDPYDMAIAYNDRCFDKMKLGNLKSALQDCTSSLRYGSLPDAYAKQQELRRMLAGRQG
jgi:tetratricopeptide (TPR) repeat protein